jgi:hypothetical protein
MRSAHKTARFQNRVAKPEELVFIYLFHLKPAERRNQWLNESARIVALLYVIITAVRTIMTVQAGSLLVGFLVLLGTVVELSVDHRIWLSWVQGALVFGIVLLVLTALKATETSTSKSAHLQPA